MKCALSGDVDPGLILYLIKSCGILPSELETILYKKSGLLGISNISSDLRDLENAASQQKGDAKLAIEAFAYRVSKYIGSYFVALGGVDAIAFSGGIGENSISIRTRICEQISCLGVVLNTYVYTQKESSFCITTEKSLVSVWVIKADENLQIAKQVYDFVTKENSPNQTSRADQDS
ncbi:MAG TPA: hypothetical protein PKA63_12665 [Oligoflexia bacterium]|nr:hypothetical protein [Oligoflexia bacterium]HMP49510.1 hypothetical protein [Oligoflexia bacterium]